MWIMIIITIAFSLVMVPIEKSVYRRISKKWLAYITTAIIASALMLGLYYGISALFGYKVWDCMK